MAEGVGEPPADRRRSWWRSELGTRVASAAVLAAALLLLTYLGGWMFGAVWLAAGIAIAVEWLAMTGAEPRLGLSIVHAVGLAACAVMVEAGWGWPAGGAIAAVMLAGSLGLARDAKSRYWAVSGFAYAAVIVIVPPLVRGDPRLGLLGVLWMFAVVWTTDIAAFFTGRALGGPKLWPSVSPKKTWSGFLGGLIASVLVAMLLVAAAASWDWRLPAGLAAITGVSALASVASQLGDLGESALKRHAGVKDSGQLIPGHGGVMDRLDGFWAVALLTGLCLAGTRLVQP